MKDENICVISGLPDDEFIQYESKIQQLFGKNCSWYKAREQNITFCSGCFNCWLKTPGICTEKDDMPQLLSSIIQSQLTVFVSTVKMGFLTALTKKCMDKMIPLISPYFDKIQNECHHAARYSSYPEFGLILLTDNSENLMDTDLITNTFKRFAINFRSRVRFSFLYNVETDNLEGLEHEITYA